MDVKTKTLKLATALTFNMVRRICLTVSMRFSRGVEPPFVDEEVIRRMQDE